MSPKSSRPGWTLVLTGVAFFMVTLDALVVMTALPVMGRDLGAGLSTLEWTVNAYALTSAAGIVTFAALGDRYGRRRLFVSGVALFTAASAACAVAPDAGALLLGAPSRAGDGGWGSPTTIGWLAGGGVLLAGFFAWERRAPAPMLPPGLFRVRGFAAASTTAFLMTASLMAAVFLV